MKKHFLFMTLIVLMSILSPDAWCDVILQIETTSVFPSSEAVFHFNMDNPDDEVAALQVDILFDTECFSVNSVNKTSRTENMDIFNYSHITGGIRIGITGIGHQIDPGNGPIVDIIVHIHDCVGEYIWDLTGSVAANPLGREILLTELDGDIYVFYCDPMIDVSSENVEFGYVPIGQTAVETVTITLGGCGWPVEIGLEPEGCADAVPRSFVIQDRDSQQISIYCRPVHEGPCEGSIRMMYSAFGPREITVSCHGFLPRGRKGDVNDDGSIDVRDVILCVNHTLGLIPLEDPNKAWASDCSGPPGYCNGDCLVDVHDVIKIVNLILRYDECLGEDVVYFNSFESDDDTSGWYGLYPDRFVDDHAPGCGGRSIAVGGGCNQPVATFNLPRQTTDGYYMLYFWSKIDTSYNEGSGTIMFTTTDTTEERPMLNVTAENATWTQYSSAESLFCPSSDHVRLEIYCGGKISVFMLLDCLTIVKIE